MVKILHMQCEHSKCRSFSRCHKMSPKYAYSLHLNIIKRRNTQFELYCVNIKLNI